VPIALQIVSCRVVPDFGKKGIMAFGSRKGNYTSQKLLQKFRTGCLADRLGRALNQSAL